MKVRLPAILLAVGLILLTACQTKPTPPQPDTTPEPSVTVATVDTSKADAVKKLQEEVLALRKQAFNLEAPKLAEQEWKDADKEYTDGVSAVDANDLDTAKTKFETAKPLFTALIQLALQRGAEQNQKLADDAKQTALNLQAQQKSSELLAKADALYAQAQEAYSKGDFANAKTLFDQAYLYYDIAGKRSKALSVKERIVELKFEAMDSGNYALAEEKFAAGDAEQDPVKARDLIEESLLRYNLVLQKGWELQAGSKKETTLSLKAQADSIKAAVSMREEYSTALAILNTANEAFVKGEYEYAALLYSQAEQLFADIYKKAAEKRAKAEAAMQAAQQKQQESQTIIDEAGGSSGTSEGGN